jgi:uncharacterized membrane protein HdeD (DUF308 family)
MTLTLLISSAAAVIVAGLVWLIATQKVTFPLLFDCGLALIALGVVALADGASREELSAGGSIMFGSGVLLLLFSYVKQTRKYDRERPARPLRKLREREMHHTPGGKQ